MGTMTKQKVRVSVNVMTKSVNYVVNTIFLLAFRITKWRGLPPHYLASNRDIIERGLFTWLAEQTLEQLHIEVISPDSSRALERWDMAFIYSADPDPEVGQPAMGDVESLCRKLRALPPGTQYRLLVQTKPGASDVEGWRESQFLPFTAAREQDLTQWGYGNIQGRLMYREGTW